MIEIIKELNIEVSKPNVFQAVVAKQYDMNTRFIKATFVDGKDKITIDPSATVKVVINALRPDGESKGFDGVVNEDGTVTVPLHSWMLELDGTVVCDISVIDIESDDNKKLTTTSFTLMVEKAAFGGDDITSDPQFDVLVALLDAATVAQEALDKSNEALRLVADCEEATENANAVREEIEAGGYIESLKEMNNGEKFTTWIGTQAEYDALADKTPNCLHIITDENDIIDTIPIESEDYPGCYYRMVGEEMEWINPPIDFGGSEYRTTERFNDLPVYVKHISAIIMDIGSYIDTPIFSGVDGQSIDIVGLSGFAKNTTEDSTNRHHWMQLSGIYAYCDDLQETTFYVRVKTPSDMEELSGATAYITVKYTKRQGA